MLEQDVTPLGSYFETVLSQASAINIFDHTVTVKTRQRNATDYDEYGLLHLNPPLCAQI